MSDNRFAASEQYAGQTAETAEATILPVYGIAQRGLQAAVDWQKFMLDTVARESMNLVKVHKTMLDAAARQSSAFVGAAQQQFEDSMTVFANLTQRWLEDVRTIQNTSIAVVRRAAQETPNPRLSKKAETGTLEVSRGNREELAHGVQQTSKSRAVLSESIQQSAGRTAEAQKKIPGFAVKQNKALTEAAQESGMADTPVTSKEVLGETAKLPMVDRPTPAVSVESNSIVDPKWNELPAEATKNTEQGADSRLTEEESAERLERTRAGLRVNGTAAADANPSVGARGADFSGVESGTGAGMGLTNTVPGDSSSPAPDIIPGARGLGMTARSDASGQTPTHVERGSDTPTAGEIAARAYQCWQERGCPAGSPEEDWARAERELQEERQGARVSAAAG